MIEALLQGKLSLEQENMEDILTSCVFGTLRLLPPASGLMPFLRQTKLPQHDSQHSVMDSLLRSHVSTAEYDFWPLLKCPGCHSCEPDVVITLPEIGLVVLIEAKLHSGKSSLPDDGLVPMDQLAREWDNLVSFAQARRCKPLLVYLTADPHPPWNQIEESINEYTTKRSGMPPPAIGWLGWHHLLQIPSSDCGAVFRLQSIVDRLGLSPFLGFSPVAPLPAIHFCIPKEQFEWPAVVPIPKVSFEAN